MHLVYTRVFMLVKHVASYFIFVKNLTKLKEWPNHNQNLFLSPPQK